MWHTQGRRAVYLTLTLKRSAACSSAKKIYYFFVGALLGNAVRLCRKIFVFGEEVFFESFEIFPRCRFRESQLRCHCLTADFPTFPFSFALIHTFRSDIRLTIDVDSKVKAPLIRTSTTNRFGKITQIAIYLHHFPDLRIFGSHFLYSGTARRSRFPSPHFH